MFSAIDGIRLQPLVALKTGEVIAHEILSSIRNHNAEKWFSELSPEKIFSLFLWQVEFALNVPGNYWLNLPVDVFSDMDKVNKILTIEHDERIVLEIQDPERLLSYPYWKLISFEEGIFLLRRAGWNIWLDDITSKLIALVKKVSVNVNGIKIDRKEIKKPFSIDRLILQASTLSPYILVEGIETEAEKKKIMLTDARYGQGFLWPEEKVYMRVPNKFY